MFNMLRMDLRRLFKSRSFYVILAVTAGLLLLVTVIAYAVADPEMMEAMASQRIMTQRQKKAADQAFSEGSWVKC